MERKTNDAQEQHLRSHVDRRASGGKLLELASILFLHQDRLCVEPAFQQAAREHRALGHENAFTAQGAVAKIAVCRHARVVQRNDSLHPDYRLRRIVSSFIPGSSSSGAYANN